MAAYGFINIQAAITGPGGNINLGYGSASSEEGITIDNVEDKNTMTIGADGAVMHSLHAGNGAKWTVRLLKTSPINALLMNTYNLQQGNTGVWGQNMLTLSDVARGDFEQLGSAAFSKPPANTYSKDGAAMEWTFEGVRNTQLGSGTPSLL